MRKDLVSVYPEAWHVEYTMSLLSVVLWVSLWLGQAKRTVLRGVIEPAISLLFLFDGRFVGTTQTLELEIMMRYFSW